MALDASIVSSDEIKPSGINNVRTGGMRYMRAPRAVTPFAADVPFRNRLCFDVVIHRMTAVA